MQEKIFIKNNHGLKLAAVLHVPGKHKPPFWMFWKKFPAVMIFHGFTGYKEEPNLETLAHDLEKNGFVVIRFDASGFGESEGTLSQDYLFSNYVADAECIYKYLKHLCFVDKNKIGVAGHSWGGKMCVIFGAHHPEIKAFVPIQAPINLRSSSGMRALIIAWQDKGWREKVSSKYGKIRIPFQIIRDDDKFDTIAAVQKIKSPIFFILGQRDNVVSPGETRKIFEKANEPKKLWEVAGIGHDYKNHPEQIDMVNREVMKFLRENL